MRTFALVGLVLLLAISYWKPLRRVGRVLGIGHLLASGYAFVLLGAAVGIGFGTAGVSPYIDELGPVIAFAAGWVGFAAGSRFERRVLATVPRVAYRRALAPAVLAATAVGLAGGIALHVAGTGPAQAVASGLCLAAAAASTGPTLAAVLRGQRAGRSRETAAVLRMIEFSSGIADGLVVILALLAFALFRTGLEPSPPAAILAMTAGACASLGVALWLFLGARASDDERLLLGLGMLAMIAGVGAWLEIPPVVVAALAAAVLANLPGDRAAAFVGAVRRVERPVVVILMTVIGMYAVSSVSWLLAGLIAAMTALRLGAKVIASGSPRQSLEGVANLGVPPGWALGLTPQGILGLVVALGFYQVWQNEAAVAVLAAVAFGGLINELIGPLAILRVLRRGPR